MFADDDDDDEPLFSGKSTAGTSASKGSGVTAQVVKYNLLSNGIKLN